MFYQNKFTKENFEALLSCLSPDREEAGKIYEHIRNKLQVFFDIRGCSDIEGLTDETFSRVVKKIGELDLSQGNKFTTIFYGFAHNVYLEFRKQERRIVPLDEAVNVTFERKSSDIKYEILDKCLNNLNPSDKDLILEYYIGDKSGKFEIRRSLAEKFNLSMGAMHTKLHRLRKSLKSCFEKHQKNNL